MSYGVSPALQKAVFAALEADTVLAALVGSDIYDVAPSGAVPGLYVTLGEEVVRNRSDTLQRAAYHDFTVSVVTDAAGFLAAKDAAAAVSDALVDAPLLLERGRLIGLSFLRANARRIAKSALRQIDLRFRALVEDD